MSDAPVPAPDQLAAPARAAPALDVPALDEVAADAARARWATRAKPPGSLGRLEDLAVHLAGVTGRCPPPVPTRPAVALFAADHGVVAEGASAWPSAITGAMVATIASGGATINALAATVGADVTVVDVGVASDLAPLGVRTALDLRPGAVVDRRIRPGTDNLARTAAMSVDEAARAVEVGREIAAELVDGGADCLVGGEMGIGNTTPSAVLIAHCTGRSAAEVTGPGAGEPPAGLGHKRDLVAAALERLAGIPDPVDGWRLLAEVGGLEIGALAGFHLEAARRRVPYVVDGVIAVAALCVAERLAPGTAARAIAGHRSREPAAGVALGHLGLEPLLDLDLRLGEGTGATLAVPLLVAATRALTDLAALPDLPVPPADPGGGAGGHTDAGLGGGGGPGAGGAAVGGGGGC